MTNPFDAFGVQDSGTSRMTIINPNTDQPYIDKDGKEAWIELAHLQGPEGRKYDVLNERHVGRLKPKQGFTRLETYNVAKLATLTRGWYLVGADGEQLTAEGKAIDCTYDNAVNAYENRWLYMQVWLHASAYENFTKAKSSG